MSTSPDHIRQVLTAYIAGVTTNGVTVGGLVVDVSAIGSTTRGYAQATTDTWREAAEPLAPDIEPTTRAGLAFFVDDRNVIDTLRSRSTHADEPWVVMPLTVRFLYAMRTGPNRTPDWDRAARAARALFSWLLAFEADDFSIQRPASGAILTRTPISGTDGSGDFLAVEVRVDAVYRYSLAP